MARGIMKANYGRTLLQKVREKYWKEEHRRNHWRRYVMSADTRLKELGLELPSAAAPVGNYVPAVRSGNLVFLSGHGPVGKDRVVTGKLGVDLTVEEGYEAAKIVAIGLLGSLKDLIGDLDKVRRIVKLLGMVNCDPAFMEQPGVIDGASDLLVEVFGEKGKHARSAVGMNALPFNIAVEIEMIVEVED
jgi:enamine deaminase RidA (YjgF/YER057c/UK114 family)